LPTGFARNEARRSPCSPRESKRAAIRHGIARIQAGFRSTWCSCVESASITQKVGGCLFDNADVARKRLPHHVYQFLDQLPGWTGVRCPAAPRPKVRTGSRSRLRAGLGLDQGNQLQVAGSVSFSCSMLLAMSSGVRMLFRSWATPLASVPIDSRRWLCKQPFLQVPPLRDVLRNPDAARGPSVRALHRKKRGRGSSARLHPAGRCGRSRRSHRCLACVAPPPPCAPRCTRVQRVRHWLLERYRSAPARPQMRS